jgi:GTP-binding protein
MKGIVVEDTLNPTPVRTLTLEAALEYLHEHEVVEIPPESIRLSKRSLNPTCGRKARSDKLAFCRESASTFCH